MSIPGMEGSETGKPKEAEPLPQGLREIIELSQDTELKDKAFYLSSIERARDVLKTREGLVKMPDLPTLVLGDIHARPEMLAAALARRIPEMGNKTVYELLEEKKINMALVGDLMHSEKEENWFVAANPDGTPTAQKKVREKMEAIEPDLSKHDDSVRARLRGSDPSFLTLEREEDREKAELMKKEMPKGLAVEKIVSDLIVRFPTHFQMVKGNHDDVNERIAGFSKHADEGLDTRGWLVTTFQDDFVTTLAEMDDNLPLVVFNRHVVVAHTIGEQPVDIASVKTREKGTVDQLTWSKPSESVRGGKTAELADNVRKIKKDLGADDDAAFLSGHQNVVDPAYPDRIYGAPADGLFQLNHPEKMVAAFVSVDKPFNPGENIIALEPAPRVSEKPKTESRLSRLWSSFKDKADRFWRENFKGEVSQKQREEEEKAPEERGKVSKLDIAKSIGMGLLGLAGTLTGTKVLADVIRYFPQKFFTSREKKQLLEAFSAQSPEVAGESKVETKAAALIAKINESRHLTKEQREKMIAKVGEITGRLNAETAEAETARVQEISRLIEDNIETRVKGTTVIKETVNTLSMLAGLQVVRGLAYGGVALVERHQRITKEKHEGKREFEGVIGWAKEFVVNGFKETWNGLMISKKDIRGREFTSKERTQNSLRAYGALARFVGLGALGAQEIFTDNGVSGSIDKMLEAWDKKSAGQFVSDNFSDNMNRLTFGGWHKLGQKVFGENPSELHGQVAVTMPGETPVEGHGDVTVVMPGETSVGGMDAEKLKAVIEVGTVHKGDGVVELVRNQLLHDPKAHGFEGDVTKAAEVAKWAKNHAIELAKQDGVITGSGETRLATESIKNVAVALKEGHIVYLDTQTGQEIPKDGLDKILYHHDYSTGKDVYPAGHSANEVHATVGHKVVRSGSGQRIVEDKPFEARVDSGNDPGHAVRSVRETGFFQNGNAEAQKFLLQSHESVQRSSDLLPIRISIDDGVKELLTKQNLTLDPSRGVEAEGDLNDFGWGTSIRDGSGHLIETENVHISRIGETIKVETFSTDGSSDVIIYEQGKVIDYARSVPEDLEERLKIARKLFRKGNEAYQEFFEKVKHGGYEIKDAVSTQLPQIGSYDKSGSMVELLGKHNLVINSSLSGIEPISGHRGDHLEWDKIFLDKGGAGALKVDQVLVGGRGENLFVGQYNSDGTVDLIRYGSGSKIESVARLVSGGKTLDQLIDEAGYSK